MDRRLRVAVVGLGSSGPASALLLAGAGHDVTLLEREPSPGAAGAGIWLQSLGQQVLDRLGLLDGLRAVSREVSRVHGLSVGGRTIMDFSLEAPALGVHRGALFDLLHRALQESPVSLEYGVSVTGVHPSPSGAVLTTTTGALPGWDLVVGADGARSALRHCLGSAVRDRPYRYGALWAVVEDPDRLAGDELRQVVEGTRHYFGVLPTGARQASIFWSATTAAADAFRAADLPAWRERARRFAGPCEPLVEGVERLLPARYRDVVVRSPYRAGEGAAVVLVGDAAHAMSPQLGAGTSIALADAWLLHRAIEAAPSLDAALAAYARERAAHVRWYQWWSRLLVPLFQSDLDPLALPRDALAPTAGRIPWVRRQMVATLAGDRTSPWGAVTLDQ